jgi:hypothetical protein
MVLRFDPLGGIPADKPIPGSYVYDWGHRNPHGGLVMASNGRIYSSMPVPAMMSNSPHRAGPGILLAHP